MGASLERLSRFSHTARNDKLSEFVAGRIAAWVVQ